MAYLFIEFNPNRCSVLFAECILTVHEGMVDSCILVSTFIISGLLLND